MLDRLNAFDKLAFTGLTSPHEAPIARTQNYGVSRRRHKSRRVTPELTDVDVLSRPVGHYGYYACYGYDDCYRRYSPPLPLSFLLRAFSRRNAVLRPPSPYYRVIYPLSFAFRDSSSTRYVFTPSAGPPSRLIIRRAARLSLSIIRSFFGACKRDSISRHVSLGLTIRWRPIHTCLCREGSVLSVSGVETIVFLC